MDRKGVRTVVAVASLAGALVVAAPASAAPGDLDPAFGTGGKTVTDLPGNVLRAPAVGLQSDGKLIVAGYTDDRLGSGFVARYSTSGILDDGGDGPGGAGFGTGDGYVTFDFGARESDDSRGGCPGRRQDRRGGRVRDSGDPSISASPAYSPTARWTRASTATARSRPTSAALSATRRWTSRSSRPTARSWWAANGVGGKQPTSRWPATTPTAPWTRASDGDGKLTTDFAGTDFVDSLAIQVDGKIVAAVGLAPAIGASRATSADGSLDDGGDGPAGTGFGGDGKVTTNFGASDFATGVAIQPDGKILVGGEGGNNFNLARYNAADGSLDPSIQRRRQQRRQGDLGLRGHRR